MGGAGRGLCAAWWFVTTVHWLTLALALVFALSGAVLVWFTRRAGRADRVLSVALVSVLLLTGCTTGPWSADLRQCQRPSAAVWVWVPLVGSSAAAALNAEQERCMADHGWVRHAPLFGRITYQPRSPSTPPPPTYAQTAARCAAAYGDGPRFESCMVTAGWPLAEVQARGRATAEPPAPK